jgi:hypothetical protein
MHTRSLTRILPLALFMGGLVSAQPTEEAFALSRKSVKGDTFSYSLTIETKVDGFDVKMKGLTSFTVVEVQPDGTIFEKVEDMGSQVDVAGTQVDLPPQEPYRQKTSMDGSRVEYLDRPFRSEDARVAQTSSFPFPKGPVKLKEAWTVDFGGDPKTGAEKAQGTYTIVEKQGTGDAATVKIEFTYKELVGDKPIDASGTVHVRLKDGVRTKMDLSARNVPMRPGQAPSDVKISYVLVP